MPLKSARQVWASRPGRARLGLAALAGLGLALGHQPFALWPLAIVALALGLHLIAREAEPGAAGWIGFAFGLGHFALALDWIVQPFMVDVARHGWMAPFALILMAGGLALFWALASVVSALAPRRMLALVVALAALELARGHVFTGFPWAQPGQVLIGTPLAQLAAWVGPNGLTAVLIAAAGLLATWRWPAVASGAAVLVAGWGVGLAQLAAPPPPAGGSVLRLVQPSVAQDLKWDPTQAAATFNRLLTATRAPPDAGQPRPDLVIWPETALPYSIERQPELAAIIATAGQGAAVAVGRQRVLGQQGWNTLTVFDAQGAALASYDKHHLVPFGEYIPLGDLAYDLFGLRAFAAQAGHAYSAGPGPQVLALGGTLGKVLPLICYEAVFPQDVRRVAERPDWLLQVTNDAWFGTYSGPFQHAAQAELRAIETGLPLVRVANTGISEVVDARGRVLARLDLGVQGHLDAALPGALPPTPYWRWGEVPLLVWLAGCGLLAFARQRRPAA